MTVHEAPDIFEEEDEDVNQENLQETTINNDNGIEFIDETEEAPDPENEPEGNTEEKEFSIIDEMLKSKGVLDPSKMKFENEDGEIEEVDFYNLTPEEQFEILNSQEETPSVEEELTDDEIDLINFIREKNLNKVEDLATYYKNEAIKELQDAYEPEYEVDAVSDDDLMAHHTKNMHPSMTEEEIKEYIDNQKVNGSLYKKTIDDIREYYRNAEIERNEALLDQQRDKERIDFEDFKNKMSTAASSINLIGGILELEDQDRNDINSYILDVDANGASKFAKDLNDPKKLFLAAWFIRKGEGAINAIQDYYKKQIENLNKPGKVTPKTPDSKEQKSNTTRIVKKDTTKSPKSNNNGVATHDDIWVGI